MGAAWLFLRLMAFLWLGNSHGQEHKTVSRISYSTLNSSGWRPNENIYLVSEGGTFCAGFYNLSASGYAFAVWYANDSRRTLAWMANTTSPVGGNSSLVLKNGTLLILDEKGQTAWRVQNSDGGTDLILQNSGNLVLSNNKSTPWESFKQFPTFSLLPGQNFTGSDSLRSRMPNADNNYYYLKISKSTNQLTLSYAQQGDQSYWQSSGNFPAVTLDDNGFLNISSIDQDSLIMASDRGEDRLRRLTLESDGRLLMYSRSKNSPSSSSSSSSWSIVWEAVPERCTIYGSCGENAICKVDDYWEPVCHCPPGFEFNAADNRTCKPKTGDDVDFVALDYVKFDGLNAVDQQLTRLEDCIDECRNNNSCPGFALKMDTGHCLFQSGKLINGYWSPEKQTRMYLKVSASAKNDTNPFTGLLSVVGNVCPTLLKIEFPPKDSDHTTRDLVIICSMFGAELLCGVLAFWAFLRKYSKFRDIARIFALDLLPSGGPKKFTYAQLKAATNNFSDILGRGGFGLVYRGLLPDQRQIAVKRLEGLRHGEQQFWAEVTIIGRIHHLNLVRMWGFCAEGEHRLLVYEYIPNGSLDKHLFDTEGPNVLEWGIRYRIALGVARAIAYLHEECLEWVLHSDIKPANILLDENFCPKVSDFGLAKLVEKERSLSVSAVRGTRGYLAPEWFEISPITAKADVYSFGMVLLEIVSGRSNLVVPSQALGNNEWYFPGWAFDMVVSEGKVEEVVDNRLSGVAGNRNQLEAVERVVKTALWCIQSRPEERPSMGKVAKMLEGTVEIQDPPKPYLLAQMDGAGDSEMSYSGFMTVSAISRF